MNKKLFSIIMPVYNVERFLKESIKSVLQQPAEENEVEFIIVDDGSTDSCPAIIDSMIADYHGNIETHVIHKENGGVGSARNAGLNISRGKWVMFIDSDDYLEKDAISIFRKYLEKYPQADYFQASAHDVAVDEGIKTIPEHYTMNRFKDLYVGDEAKWFLFVVKIGPHVTPWAKLYRRDIIRNERFCEKLKSSNDFDFNMRVWQNVKYAVCIKEYVYIRNRRNGSIVEGGVLSEQMYKDEMIILNSMLDRTDMILPYINDDNINMLRYIICRYVSHFIFFYGKRYDEFLDPRTEMRLRRLLSTLGMRSILSYTMSLRDNEQPRGPILFNYQKKLRSATVLNTEK